MPYNIIVTLQAAFDAEVYQGALALIHKLKPGSTIWVNVDSKAAPAKAPAKATAKKGAPAKIAEPALKWVAQICLAPCEHEALSKLIDSGAMALDGGALYLVAHGAGVGPNAPGGGALKAEPLAEVMTEVLRYLLRVPMGTRFEKLVLMVCNLGKTGSSAPTGAGPAAPLSAETLAPPTYLPLLLSKMPYAFDRVVAWNGWVSVFTFKHLASLVKKHEREIIETMMKLWALMAPKYKAHLPLMQDKWLEELGPDVTFSKEMTALLSDRLSAVPLADLLRLVGKRLNNNGRFQPAFLSSPNMFGIDAAMPIDQSLFMSVEAARRREAILKAFELMLGPVCAGIILKYEGFGVWTYYPGKNKLCLYGPAVALALGVTKV